MTVFIYSLTDPRTNEIRYVGKAMDVQHRLGQHYSDTRGESQRARWIRELRAENLKPAIEVLEMFPDSDGTDWQNAERWWIAYLRFIGCPLVNLDLGGHGGRKMCSESKEKCRLIHLGKKRSPETLAKLSAIRKGRKLSPESIAKIVAKNKGPRPWQKMPEAHKARLVAIHTGRKHSEEEKKRRADAIRGKKRTPEQVARLSAGLAPYWEKCRLKYAPAMDDIRSGATISEAAKKHGLDYSALWHHAKPKAAPAVPADHR